MKNILSIFIMFIGFNTLNAQSMTEDAWLKVVYMQVEPAEIDAFLASVDTGFKRILTDRVNSGEIERWHFYRVSYSGDRDKSYNFVSVEMASSLNALQSEDRMSTREYRKTLEKLTTKKYVVHTEIWNTQAVVNDGVGERPSRFMNVNYMSAATDRIDDYLNLEMEIAAPLHTHQTENERMDGWEFHRLVFPTGVTSPFNFITTDFYSNIEQIEMGITRQVMEEVHPDMDVDEFEDFADSIRQRMHSDLWELLEYAFPE